MSWEQASMSVAQGDSGRGNYCRSAFAGETSIQGSSLLRIAHHLAGKFSPRRGEDCRRRNLPRWQPLSCGEMRELADFGYIRTTI